MRLIDADALLTHEQHAKDVSKYDSELLVVGKDFILNAPTIDDIQIVRCERCAALEANVKYPTAECEPYYCHELERNVYTIGYCGYGRTG